MAEDGYWAKQFRDGAPEAVAKSWLSSGNHQNRVLHHIGQIGIDRLVEKTQGSWKRENLAKAVIEDMKLVPEIIRDIQSSSNFVMGPILSGLSVKDQISKNDIQAKMWLDKSPDHVIFYGPYSETLETFLISEVGKVISNSEWFKKNIKSIRSAAAKINAVKKVMNQ
jgi:hypothetical protein